MEELTQAKMQEIWLCFWLWLCLWFLAMVVLLFMVVFIVMVVVIVMYLWPDNSYIIPRDMPTFHYLHAYATPQTVGISSYAAVPVSTFSGQTIS